MGITVKKTVYIRTTIRYMRKKNYFGMNAHEAGRFGRA
jgi:hypothetical protein